MFSHESTGLIALYVIVALIVLSTAGHIAHSHWQYRQGKRDRSLERNGRD